MVSRLAEEPTNPPAERERLRLALHQSAMPAHCFGVVCLALDNSHLIAAKGGRCGRKRRRQSH